MSGLRRNRSTKYADEYPPPTILRPICKETFKSWKLASEEAGIISRFVTRTKITEQAKVTSTVTARITVQLRDLKERNVTKRIDGVTVEHCLTHLGYEARPSQLRLDEC
ncbi:hypothetical protein RB195_022837 [Necator americanus]|uniref:Transposase Tc1-like domain-containing protein n=1 Tax=Necator americanus TaxID=51031 RepID=A0ABR1EGU0_NECAM